MRIDHQKNPWGLRDGLELQRSDLWQLNFDLAIHVLNQVYTKQFGLPLFPGGSLSPLYAQSVALPSMVTKPDPIRRDSRAYNMPSHDDPVETVRMTFLFESRKSAEGSIVYNLFNAWRCLVRSGRGGVSDEAAFTLNDHYGIGVWNSATGSSGYAFDIVLKMLRGMGDALSLQDGPVFILVRAWPVSFKISELNNSTQAAPVTLEVVFAVENVVAGDEGTANLSLGL